eukprot:c20439_g1_i1.p1 GENE.c20439_g1_i1~~c20439_g1_i1.p1  ORF type:complete len:692 (+),score=282.87 c20439_g1_i1:30-2105(+)
MRAIVVNRQQYVRPLFSGQHQPNNFALGFKIFTRMYSFTVDPKYVSDFKNQKVPFGFNGLGELVYYRTYSRQMKDGKQETWPDTVERVVNGTFSLQKDWMLSNNLPWDEKSSQELSQAMFKKIFEMKFLPPGRGLWAMGSPITEERKLYAALNNCAFVSTANLKQELSKPFTFLMDATMLGVGVGFDTKGAHTKTIRKPKGTIPVLIADSREGWVNSLQALLDAYLAGGPLPIFDYSAIRPAGIAIKGFGGVSSGPAPLKTLHENINDLLARGVGKKLSVTAIVDIMNFIGKCVVSGNVRRTAEIAFGDPDCEEYIDLKNYSKNPHRVEYGWTSNNSVFAELGMDYSKICKRIVQNGEPGFAWLENMRKYGRMKEQPNYKDIKACGGNPCLEQTLESYELCCLVETFPHHHRDLDEFLDTLKYAFLYAKIVTLGPTHWEESNKVMSRNRRIGTSISGIAQFLTRPNGEEELQKWCDKGYEKIQQLDEEYSKLFNVPQSIKTTSVKPSGTVSLLAGATPGMHYPEYRYYIRRVRLSKNSPLISALEKANYKIEAAVNDPQTLIVEIPIDVGENVKTTKEVSMWDQLNLAAFLQKYWADNQVSCTVTIDPETEGHDLPRALNHFQYHLKGISFLPRIETGAYPQMPYEAITQEEFLKKNQSIQSVQWSEFFESPSSRERPDDFCDSATCQIGN